MIFVYQLKVGLCLAIFYLIFKLLLSRETFHRFNRVVLLLLVAGAIVLPWVKLSLSSATPISEAVIDLEGFFLQASIVNEPSSTTGTSLVWVLTLIYYIGIAMVALWLLSNLWQLFQLLRRGSGQPQPDGTVLHIMPTDVSPFSYFRHIVISQNDYATNADEILTHERAHIRLHHSFDIVFADLLIVLQWWNPAAWLMKRELQQIHEFEADEAVLQRGVDARQYQLLLIRKSVGNQLFSMANNLNYHSLKKRIRMMNKKASNRWQRLKVLAVLPLAAVAVIAFASPKVENIAEGIAQQSAKSEGLPEVTVVGYADYTAPQDTTEVFDVVEQMPEFPGGIEGMIQFLQTNMKYPEDAMKEKKEGRVLVGFIVDREGNVTEPQVLQGVWPSLDAEAIRVVNAMPKWTPGMQGGKIVRVKFALPISFRLQ